nr:Chain C, NAP1_LIR motif [Homo sapiens]
EDDICILNHEK